MIITEKVVLNVNRHGKYKEIKVSELSKGSHSLIEVQCDVCGNIKTMEYRTYLLNMKYGFYSCIKCKNIKSNKTNLEKYGCENVFQNNDIKRKSKNTIINKYGVDNVSKSNVVKNKKIKTNMKHWGTKWGLSSKIIIEKRFKTNLEKYGVKNVFQNEMIKNKIKNTNYERYGVEYVTQNEYIYKKILKTSALVSKYRNTELNYQCSFEKDFLDRYYDKINIINGFPIKYKYDGKEKTYYPDFYLPDYNLIVEIKGSNWYMKYLDKNLSKKEKCIDDGYDFIFIIDKNYDEFNEKLHQNFLG